MPSILIYHVCHKVRTWRKAKKLSQKDAAELLNMDQGAYSLLENGKKTIDVEMIVQICQLYNKPTYELLFDENDLNNRDLNHLKQIEISCFQRVSSTEISVLKRINNELQNQLNNSLQLLAKLSELKTS